MHDSKTVAFEIPNPFARRYPWANDWGGWWFRWAHRPALIVIWHNDPESDGSDDSCGWRGPRRKDWPQRFAKWPAKELSWYATGHGVRWFDHPDFPRCMLLDSDDGTKENFVFHGVSQGDALALTIAAFRIIAWQCDRKELSPKLLAKAIELGTTLDAGRRFDPTSNREERLSALTYLVSDYLRATRPWWRHPRWHVWHWSIQVPPLQRLMRWIRRKRLDRPYTEPPHAEA